MKITINSLFGDLKKFPDNFHPIWRHYSNTRRLMTLRGTRPGWRCQQPRTLIGSIRCAFTRNTGTGR